MLECHDGVPVDHADPTMRLRTSVSALLYRYMVGIGSILLPNIFLLVHAPFSATGLHSPFSRNRAAAERRTRSYTVIARRKQHLKPLHERELPAPQQVENGIVQTHPLPPSGQNSPAAFSERADGQIGHSLEFFSWNDDRELYHNGSCEFDGLPNLLLDQRTDSHQPDHYQWQSLPVDIETGSIDLKDVMHVRWTHMNCPLGAILLTFLQQTIATEHHSGAMMSSGQSSKFTTTTLTLENMDIKTRTVILDILMKARIPTTIRID